MQELPQPPDQPSVDGCPIVELQDTTVDVEHLLNALYNPCVPPSIPPCGIHLLLVARVV
jgi:hypothetical protein